MNIVKLCRDLGLGCGGFYQPGYRDGAKLNLMMMCLGKNWDPETSQYGVRRPVDGAIPPKIPDKFFQLVESAIKESQSLIMKDSKTSNSDGILPGMMPDICLVNFYSSSGRLGLHQVSLIYFSAVDSFLSSNLIVLPQSYAHLIQLC